MPSSTACSSPQRPGPTTGGWGSPGPAYPATVGAAEVLSPEDLRRVVGGYLVVERRVATAVLDLAAEVAREERTRPSAPAFATGDIDRPPAGVDPREHPHVAWWHGV